MRSRAYTISSLIDDLTAIYHEHGDIPVENGRGTPLFARQLDVVECDDWDNVTETEDGDIPGIGHALQIGPRF